MAEWQCIAVDYYQDGSAFFKCLLTLKYPIWLDSCAHATSGRYDIFTAAPYQTFNKSTDDSIDFLATLKQNLPTECAEFNGLFFSGMMGYFGYEFGVSLDGLSCQNRKISQLPDAWFGLYYWALVLDHHQQRASILFNANKAQALSLVDLQTMWQQATDFKIPLQPFTLTQAFQSNISVDVYQQALSNIHQHLCAGDSYQVNYTHCFSAAFEGEPFEAYCRLRQQNPAEFAAFIRLPEADILSFSPELLVRAKYQHLMTKPIKGTMARGQTPADDLRQKQKLESCSKNRAENMMIVDLLRNDLSLIAEIDSVKVTEFLKVEPLTNVFHLVSSITAKLNQSYDYLDVIRALFPGGSITGAPKYRTMELIEQYETQARGVYCGAIGYLSSSTDMCFNIAIRTMTASQKRIYCPAGGGIVLDSNSQEEYQETIDKVSVLTHTLENYGIL